MSNPVSGIVPGAIPQVPGGAGKPQPQTGQRSFESVMQEGGKLSGGADPKAPTAAQNEGVSGARLEEFRLNLERSLNRIPPGDKSIKSIDQLWPELHRLNNHRSMLREAMKGVDNTPTGTNLKGLFGKVENEWFSLEQIMRSDKDLSTGELLGLQARLYQVAQHIEVMSKVVDQMTGGIKTILNTNV